MLTPDLSHSKSFPACIGWISRLEVDLVSSSEESGKVRCYCVTAILLLAFRRQIAVSPLGEDNIEYVVI